MVMRSGTQNSANYRSLVIGSLLLSIAICVGFSLFLALLSLPSKTVGEKPSAKLGIVLYNIPTSTVPIPTPPNSPAPESIDGIHVGSVVQIFGTEGAGLKIRGSASIQAEEKIIALDSEVFEVTGGPIAADEYTWWQLTSPYDSQRSGWAVSKYLSLIQ